METKTQIIFEGSVFSVRDAFITFSDKPITKAKLRGVWLDEDESGNTKDTGSAKDTGKTTNTGKTKDTEKNTNKVENLNEKVSLSNKSNLSKKNIIMYLEKAAAPTSDEAPNLMTDDSDYEDKGDFPYFYEDQDDNISEGIYNKEYI